MSTDDRSRAQTERELAELFRQHREGLAGAVRGVLGPVADVQEVLQDAFLKGWRALREGAVPRDPRAWVFVITLNMAKDRRRRARRRAGDRPLDEALAMELHAKEPAPAATAETAETLAAARTAIHGLRDAEKEVFLMRVSGGLSFGATAEALGIPVGTVKTRMRAALARLRQDLRAFAPDANQQREEA